MSHGQRGLWLSLGPLCALVLVVASCGSSASPPTWSDAIEVPGTAALNNEGQADVRAVSCATAGNCVAGGEYQNSKTGQPAFVVEETNGSWGKAFEVPGMTKLDRHNSSLVTSISCTSAGNCSAGGGYYDEGNYQQAFVVDETNGTWGTAIEVPGTGALNTAGDATVGSISCATPGNCVAGGYFSEPGSSNINQAFLAEEKNGRWGKAIAVPGTTALNTGGTAGVASVSCAAPGNCTAGGSYSTRDGAEFPFVIDETNGRWGSAITIRGAGAAPGTAGVVSLSCPTAGNCAAGIGADNEVFVADETHGVWGEAIPVPGTRGVAAYMYSVFCTKPGNCTAGGSSRSHAFVADEKNGRWGKAVDVPGIAGLGRGGDSAVTSISCVTPGTCAAGGFYDQTSSESEVFVVDKTNGTWEKAIQVPGSSALNSGDDASLNAISCAAARDCTAGGSFTAWDRNSDNTSVQAFVVSSSRRPRR